MPPKLIESGDGLVSASFCGGIGAICGRATLTGTNCAESFAVDGVPRLIQERLLLSTACRKCLISSSCCAIRSRSCCRS